MFSFKSALELPYADVKLRGYTEGGSEEVLVAGQYKYKNILDALAKRNQKMLGRSGSQKRRNGRRNV